MFTFPESWNTEDSIGRHHATQNHFIIEYEVSSYSRGSRDPIDRFHEFGIRIILLALVTESLDQRDIAQQKPKTIVIRLNCPERWGLVSGSIRHFRSIPCSTPTHKHTHTRGERTRYFSNVTATSSFRLQEWISMIIYKDDLCGEDTRTLSWKLRSLSYFHKVSSGSVGDVVVGQLWTKFFVIFLPSLPSPTFLFFDRTRRILHFDEYMYNFRSCFIFFGIPGKLFSNISCGLTSWDAYSLFFNILKFCIWYIGASIKYHIYVYIYFIFNLDIFL